MKNKFVIFIFLFSMIFSKPLFAEDMVMKLSRGIVNIVTSPVEYYVQYNYSAENTNPLVGAIGGLLYGTGYTAARIISGAYDIVTFPIPLPRNYEPLMKPDTGIEAVRALQGQEFKN